MAREDTDLTKSGDQPFVSYAQNFEDVMLWRALGGVEGGFYVDIGAQHPVIDSVSRAFYERGWRGIHVEPIATYADLLRKGRPDEEVLQAAVSSRDGILEIFEIPETGLSTPVPKLAARYAASGYQCISRTVACITLDTLLARFDDREVHWLKIDVEGYEARVLDGWNAARARPWVVVVESTTPLQQHDTSGEWEEKILALGYEHAYFDGLNRFYVSNLHRELRVALRIPPNVFDRFELSGLSSFGLGLTRRIDELTVDARELQSARLEIDQRRTEMAALEGRLEALQCDAGRFAEAVRGLEFEIARRDTSNARLEVELTGARDRAARAEARELRLASEATQHHALIAELGAQVVSGCARANELATALQRLEQEIRQRDQFVDQLNGTITHWAERAQMIQRHADHFEALYRSIVRSRSWQFTAPLRRLAQRLRPVIRGLGVTAGSVAQLPHKAIHEGMLRAVAHLRAHPRRKAALVRMIGHMRPVDRALRAMLARHAISSTQHPVRVQSLARRELTEASATARDLARRLDYVVELEMRIEELERFRRQQLERLTHDVDRGGQRYGAKELEPEGSLGSKA